MISSSLKVTSSGGSFLPFFFTFLFQFGFSCAIESASLWESQTLPFPPWDPNQYNIVLLGYSCVILAKEEAGQLSLSFITYDHKPYSPKEKSQIFASGGRVIGIQYNDGIDGPPHVWLGHMDLPALAMSRSLGDTVAHTAGVISEPEFTEHNSIPQLISFL